MMNFSRTRTAPTGYEKVRIIFHAIRTGQLLASLVTGLILLYFIGWLRHDGYGVPWTFLILTCVSLLTVVSLTATIAFHCLTGLSPRLNLMINSVILVLWTIGFGLLFRWSWFTLSNRCDIINWNEDKGVMVCQIYKALFTFSLLGFLSTIAAVALDLHIHRLATRFGTHMRLDNYDSKGRNQAVRGPYTEDAHNDVEDYPRHSEAFEIPESGYGAHNGGTRGERAMENQGYAVPDGQFEYDTGYRGGHDERALR